MPFNCAMAEENLRSFVSTPKAKYAYYFRTLNVNSFVLGPTKIRAPPPPHSVFESKNEALKRVPQRVVNRRKVFLALCSSFVVLKHCVFATYFGPIKT